MKMLFLILAFTLSHPIEDGTELSSTSYGISLVESCDAGVTLPLVAEAYAQVRANFPEAEITGFGSDCVELDLSEQRGA